MSDTYLPGDTRQRIQDLIKNRKITHALAKRRVLQTISNRATKSRIVTEIVSDILSAALLTRKSVVPEKICRGYPNVPGFAQAVIQSIDTDSEFRLFALAAPARRL